MRTPKLVFSNPHGGSGFGVGHGRRQCRSMRPCSSLYFIWIGAGRGDRLWRHGHRAVAVGSGAEGERYQQSRRDPTRNDEYRRSETRGRANRSRTPMTASPPGSADLRFSPVALPNFGGPPRAECVELGGHNLPQAPDGHGVEAVQRIKPKSAARALIPWVLSADAG